MVRIAVLVSGGGTNLQALLDRETAGELGSGKITLVISSDKKAYALERAKQTKIPTAVVSKKSCSSHEDFDQKILALLQEHKIQLVVLAGFMSILGESVIAAYPQRILNVHPSLIPSFCGVGFYGMRVHEAALAYGVKVTGATVHFVNEVPDGGNILLQKAVMIEPGDTPEQLQRRVMEQAEWILLPQATRLVCEEIESERSK